MDERSNIISHPYDLIGYDAARDGRVGSTPTMGSIFEHADA